MSIINVTEKTFKDEVTESTVPVVADFWASWCAPCRMLAPVFEELSMEIDNLKFVKINVDEEQMLAQTFGVMSIPTTIVFKNGREAKRFLGFMPKSQLKKSIESALV
jgi:thioredoxin 1